MESVRDQQTEPIAFFFFLGMACIPWLYSVNGLVNDCTVTLFRFSSSGAFSLETYFV